MPPTVQPRESDLRLLFAINQILVGSLEPLAVLEPVLAALVEGTHLQHAVVAKVHRRSGELRIAAAVGLTPEEHRAAEQRVDDGPISRAVSEAQPLTLPLDGERLPQLGFQRSRDRTADVVNAPEGNGRFWEPRHKTCTKARPMDHLTLHRVASKP